MMTINIIQIIIIIIVAGLCWYVNQALNQIPVLKNVINVIIVVVSVLAVLSSLGIFSGSGVIHI